MGGDGASKRGGIIAVYVFLEIAEGTEQGLACMSRWKFPSRPDTRTAENRSRVR